MLKKVALLVMAACSSPSDPLECDRTEATPKFGVYSLEWGCLSGPCELADSSSALLDVAYFTVDVGAPLYVPIQQVDSSFISGHGSPLGMWEIHGSKGGIRVDVTSGNSAYFICGTRTAPPPL